MRKFGSPCDHLTYHRTSMYVQTTYPQSPQKTKAKICSVEDKQFLLDGSFRVLLKYTKNSQSKYIGN